jgi:hypothetical protein
LSLKSSKIFFSFQKPNLQLAFSTEVAENERQINDNRKKAKKKKKKFGVVIY